MTTFRPKACTTLNLPNASVRKMRSSGLFGFALLCKAHELQHQNKLLMKPIFEATSDDS